MLWSVSTSQVRIVLTEYATVIQRMNMFLVVHCHDGIHRLVVPSRKGPASGHRWFNLGSLVLVKLLEQNDRACLLQVYTHCEQKLLQDAGELCEAALEAGAKARSAEREQLVAPRPPDAAGCWTPSATSDDHNPPSTLTPHAPLPYENNQEDGENGANSQRDDDFCVPLVPWLRPLGSDQDASSPSSDSDECC